MYIDSNYRCTWYPKGDLIIKQCGAFMIDYSDTSEHNVPIFCAQTIIPEFQTSTVAFYQVDGEPISLQRPRFYSGRIYDSQKAAKFTYSNRLRIIHDDKPLYTGPLHMEILFYFQPPKKMAYKKRNAHRFHHFKPDIDNCIKWVLDCANGVLYNDDSCVSSLNTRKYYSDDPRTCIKLSKIIQL
jgi:Holliday junction resolvase RusA-like endonuclease